MLTEKGQAFKSLWNSPLPAWPRDKLRNAAVFCAAQLGAALLGGLLAQSHFASGAFAAAAPFAVALAAAVTAQYLGAAVLGAAAGCLLYLPWPACITAMAACAVAGLCNLAFRRLGTRRSIAVPLTAYACAFFSGAVTLITLPPAGPMAWVNALCGAVLSGCCAYFFVVVQGIRKQEALAKYHISRRECAALLLCCGMLLASVGGVTWGVFRPANCLAALLVLVAAYCWRESGGAAAGTCAGAALALAGQEPATAAVFALGGLLAGVFCFHGGRRSSGKELPSAVLTVPVAGGFALACVFYVTLRSAVPDPADTVMFAIECMTAIALFIAVPGKQWNRLRITLAAANEAMLAPADSEACLKVSQTAGALRKVGEFVSEVAQGLEKLNAPVEQSIYAGVEESLCKGCVEYSYCYEDRAEASRVFHLGAVKQLRRGSEFSLEDMLLLRRESGLALPCRAPEQLRASLLRSYDIYAARETCVQAESQLRRAAAAQFDAVSELMEELSDQLARQSAFETEAAQSAIRVLEDHGFHTRAVSCVRSAGANNAAQLTAAVRPEKGHSSREELTRALRRATGIVFDLPAACPLPGEDGALFTFSQQPQFQFSTGAVQMSSSSSDYCGDYFDCFNDGHGREVLVISDGMGTGGRAAVDSALATEIFSSLARSGLSFAGAMRIANQALLLKSCEETLATLDAAGVNLYTGEVEFCKAGGAVSFIRQGGKASKVELSALPAGILRNINPAEHHVKLSAGDIIVLVSDGMLCDSDSWLCDELALWKDENMQALAEHLAARAVALRRERSELPQREDDLTVVCGMIRR